METAMELHLEKSTPLRDHDFERANDPSTSPGELATLAGSKDSQLRQAVARNPNTPQAELENLWIDDPLAVLDNPVTQLNTLMEGTSAAEWLPGIVQVALCSALIQARRRKELQSTLPAEMRLQILTCLTSYRYSNSELREACRARPDIRDTFFKSLPDDPDSSVRLGAIQVAPNCVQEALAKDPDPEVRLALAQRAGLDSERCFAPPSRSVGSVLQRRQHVSPEAKVLLADDLNAVVRGTIAKCRSLPPQAFDRLSCDSDLTVKSTLAATRQGHPDLLATSWRRLARSSDDVARSVALNETCHPEIKLELLNHESKEVRCIAWKQLPMDIESLSERAAAAFENLQRREDADRERQSLAANRHITAEIAGRLASMGPAVTRILARNGSLPGHISFRLLDHPDGETALAAVHPYCSVAIANRIAAYGSRTQKKRLASLPGRGAAVLRNALAKDRSMQVRQAVARYLCRRVRYHGGSRIRQGLECLSRDSEASIRAMVASDHRLSDATISRLAVDPSPRVRQEVIEHHPRQAPGDLGLLDEPSEHVRFRAAKTLLRGWGRTPKQLARLSEKVAADPSTRLRWVAAGSGVCSRKAIRLLIDDPEIFVQRQLLQHSLPKTAAAINRSWAGIKGTKAIRVKQLEKSSDPNHRALAAALTAAGKRRLDRLANDPCWYVRAVALSNTRITRALVKRLARDLHPLVRETAVGQLKQLAA